jgi:hypothetical protein
MERVDRSCTIFWGLSDQLKHHLKGPPSARPWRRPPPGSLPGLAAVHPGHFMDARVLP